ncbi:ClpP/crotonase-like domain-containing protein [Baffinella frigidus]|nr:ClpP/crotonase-like domain-containing protein [Cryptophyta sp. CCMP2293]
MPSQEQRVWPGSPAEGTPEADKLTKNKPHIALITAAGSIGRGQGGRDQEGVYSEAVCSAIREAAKSKIVKAIVMRVDSPGGSAVASDSIRRELEYARSLGKPVVVSMGAVAASGGYYIATAADKVVAQPGTITGSIGAFSGKLMISGMLEKLGVGFDRHPPNHT